MRDTLENLYFGSITPNERQTRPNSSLQKAMDQSEECEEKLTTRLEEQDKVLLRRLLNAENEICSTMALEQFILGFRLGARIVLEALDEDNGELSSIYKEE